MPSVCSKQIQLTINGPETRDLARYIDEESTVIIGTSDACKIQLDHASISPKHCLLRFTGGNLIVRDWFSATGTLVDGEPTLDEVSIESDCCLTLGEFAIDVQFSKRRTRDPINAKQLSAPKSAQCAAATTAKAVSEEHLPTEVTAILEDKAGPEDSTVLDENMFLEDRVSHQHPESLTLIENKECSKAFGGLSKAPSSIEEEQINLLLEEVELLQSELALRDARLAEIECETDVFNCSEFEPEESENDSVKHRLNELLDELARGDQRIRTLEDLLQFSEDATAAEREERFQIEAWVNDLERRIGEREAEWQAEIEVLNHRNDELRIALIEQESRSQKIASEVGLETQENAIQELRMENERIRLALEETVAENKKLTAELTSTDTQARIKQQQELVENAIREEQVRIAKERAEFSRQKAELHRQVGELEHQLSERKPINEAEQKFRAFREHLKEIHEYEKQIPKKQKPLSKRLKELWQRLDGPTDTD